MKRFAVMAFVAVVALGGVALAALGGDTDQVAAEVAASFSNPLDAEMQPNVNIEPVVLRALYVVGSQEVAIFGTAEQPRTALAVVSESCIAACHVTAAAYRPPGYRTPTEPSLGPLADVMTPPPNSGVLAPRAPIALPLLC